MIDAQLELGRRGRKHTDEFGFPLTPFAFALHSKYHCVYIIRDKELGSPCKVGMAENPESRLRGIQCDSWRELELGTFFWFVGRLVSERVERRAHELLSDKNLRGEWFTVGVEEAEEAVVLAALDLGAEIIDEDELEARYRRFMAGQRELHKRELDFLECRA